MLKFLDNLGGDLSKYGDLTTMCLDEKHRKVFIGDTNGDIRAFNVNNGVELGVLKLSDEIIKKLEK